MESPIHKNISRTVNLGSNRLSNLEELSFLLPTKYTFLHIRSKFFKYNSKINLLKDWLYDSKIAKRITEIFYSINIWGFCMFCKSLFLRWWQENLTMQVSRSWYSSFIEYQNNEKVMWLKSSYIKFQNETNHLAANLMLSILIILFFLNYCWFAIKKQKKAQLWLLRITYWN